MSNYLAIATVTAALADVVHTAMLDDGPGMVRDVRVVAGPPRAEDSPRSPQINIFLYQVTPNTALRNNDLPTRSTDGTTRQRPQVALDLDYLISFHGDDNQLEPQRMLGKVVSVLHSQPLLTQQRIRLAIDATHGREGDYLIDSDLADQTEKVKFSPLTLSLEELSKLWSILFQAPYALSILYRASTVLIESDVEVITAPPVEHPAIDVSVKSGRSYRG